MQQDRIRECIICGLKGYTHKSPRIRKEMCMTHYTRMMRHGDVTIVKQTTRSGRMKHPLYWTYVSMVNRCTQVWNTNYKNYGKRGIKVCEEWLDREFGFERFAEFMGERPVGMTMDRIDVNGDYEPSNVRWADWKTQANNKRNSL